jgi:uncharacterized membrane protein
MEDFLLDWYPWIKAVHIIAVISWMAGMLYLPRLFVYHVDAEIGSVQSETFKVMSDDGGLDLWHCDVFHPWYH